MLDRLARSTVAVALALLLCALPARAGWTPVGELPSAGTADGPGLAQIGGAVYVAVADTGTLRVLRLEPSGQWQPVGGALHRDRGATARLPRLASVGGVPHVAWIEADAVHVARLGAAGTVWEQVGGGPVGSAVVVSQSPSLIDVAGVPWLAWTQDEPGTPGRPVRRVYVVRLADSGGAWEPVGPALNRSETESADAPALLAAGGGAYIAWSEDTEGLMAPYSVIRVASFDPCACSGWREIGDGVPASGGSSATHPSLASVGGRLFVAWELTESYSRYSELLDVRVGVLGADGGTWEILTPRGLDTHQIDHEGRPTLAEIGGRLHLAWSMRGGAHVARLDGDGVTFERLPGPNRAAGSDLALAGVNGAPWIALPRQAAVERLEPDLLAATVSTTTSTASLTGEVNTYGMPVEIGFEYGDEGQTTALLPESGHIARTITGLAPGTTYSYRLHARWGDTVPAGRSDSHQLVTKPAGGVAQPGEPEPTEPTDSTEPTGMPPEGNAAPVLPPGPTTPPAAAAAAPVLGSPALRLTTIRRPRASLDRSRLTMVRGRRLRIRYRIATAGTVALRIMRGGRTVGYGTSRHRRDARAYFDWDGRIGGTAARAGEYSVRLEWVAAGRNTVVDRAQLRIRRR